MLSGQLVGQLTKVVWLTAFLDKKKMFFIQHSRLASQCLTSKFDNIKVPLSNVMTFILNSILLLCNMKRIQRQIFSIMH